MNSAQLPAYLSDYVDIAGSSPCPQCFAVLARDGVPPWRIRQRRWADHRRGASVRWDPVSTAQAGALAGWPRRISKRNVIVLGDELTRNLFSGRPALGAFILLNDVRFEVIGTLKRMAAVTTTSPTSRRHSLPGDRNLLPAQGSSRQNSTLLMIVGRVPRLSACWRGKKSARWSPAITASITAMKRPGNLDTVEQAEMMGEIFDAMDMFLALWDSDPGIGAVGIINIMLVAVRSALVNRLRKALGATDRNILLQFFLEGILLTLLSGLIGMGLAGRFMALLGTQPSPGNFDPPKLVPASAILAIVCLTLAGVVAGLYPARKAAMLPPVEALRQE